MAKQKKSGDAAPDEREDSLEEVIRTLAYRLYCEGGYQDGRDVEYWVEAERQVYNRRNPKLRKIA